MDYANGTFRASGRTPGQQPQASAFSLAELMIALVILGLGLLFIAAALPVGLEYTRQTVDLANADAARECALRQLEMNLRTSMPLYDLDVSKAAPLGTPIRLDNIHRPRTAASNSEVGDPRRPHALNNIYEPFIKVRPLVMGNIRMGSIPASGTREIVDDVEATIERYLSAIAFPMPGQQTLEIDISDTAAWWDLRTTYNPALPGLARVYPPTEPVTTFSVNSFFDNNLPYRTYQMRLGPNGALSALQQQNEWEQALDRRVAWTAFYRRLSYRFVDPDDPVVIDGDELAEDPLLYELIIVVTQRVSVNHRFPRQRVTLGGVLGEFESPQAWTPNTPPPSADNVSGGIDRLAPMPWLVTFDTGQGADWVSPLLTTPADYIVAGNERVLLYFFDDPPTLTFRCTSQVGALLPVGSVFIPAANDQIYLPVPPYRPQQVGFVPSAANSLPIYEVVERPDDTTIIVRNNGFYPWLANPNQPQGFPVWVIPPAFVERDSGGQPIYERNSPILKVIRRTVTLREINP